MKINFIAIVILLFLISCVNADTYLKLDNQHLQKTSEEVVVYSAEDIEKQIGQVRQAMNWYADELKRLEEIQNIQKEFGISISGEKIKPTINNNLHEAINWP